MTQRDNARKTTAKKTTPARGGGARTARTSPAAKASGQSSAARERASAAAPKRTTGRSVKARQGGESTFIYIVSLVIFFFSIFALVAVVSYFLTWREDQSIDFDSFFVFDPLEARNLMGRLGAVMGNLFVGRWFGIFGICVPVLMTILSLALFRIRVRQMRKSFVSVLMLMVIGSLAAAHFWPESDGVFGSSLGGGFGYYTAGWMDTLLGGLGTDIIILMLVCLWLVYTTHYTVVFFRVVASSIGEAAGGLAGMLKPSPKVRRMPPAQRVPAPVAPAATVSSAVDRVSAKAPETQPRATESPDAVKTEPVAAEKRTDPAPEEEIVMVSANADKASDNDKTAPQNVPDRVGTVADDAPSAGAFVKPEFHPQPLSERIDPLAFSKVDHGIAPNVKERRTATGKVRDDYGVPIDLDRAVLFTAPIIDDSGRLVTSDDRTLNQMSDEEIDELLSLANDDAAVSHGAERRKKSPAVVVRRGDDEPFIVEERPSDDAGFVVDDDEPVGTEFGIGSVDDVAEEMEIERKHADDVEFVVEKRMEDVDGYVGSASAQGVFSGDSDGFGNDIAGEREEFEVAVTDNASFVGSDGCFDDDELVLTTNSADMLDDGEIDPSVFDPTLELSRYKLPSVDLLDNHTRPVTVTEQEIYENKNSIVRTLENFSIKIDKIKATIGPTVTLYEIVPAPGVRISKIKNLEDDIALSLSALGIRIIAPIPGKGTIGIEVPNKDKEVVSMYSVIKSSRFQDSGYDLPVVLGRTIQNEDFVIDLAKMPHMLVAGATGQGKSVGLNAIITSLLYKKHPAELKFVLVDPKKVELTLYANLERHFLAKMPQEDEAIITDTQKVVYTLNSLCMEMDSRYDLLKKAKVRNIKEYNEKFTARRLNPHKGHRFMPYFVVIIDEFADLIMTAGREIETPIARLAQLARAVGIHLVIATQRPTTNIITGVIKANFPARIAFRVSSMIDSRTILDQPGANQLIGRGDMLVSTGNETTRVQCAFIDTPEVEKITEYIGSQQGYSGAYELPEYQPEESKDTDAESAGVSSRRDGLFEEVARYVVTNQQGSASTIQRNFSIGFNRAGRIMDQLERAGIVGKQNGSKPRTVLVGDIASLEVLLYELDRGAQPPF